MYYCFQQESSKMDPCAPNYWQVYPQCQQLVAGIESPQADPAARNPPEFRCGQALVCCEAVISLPAHAPAAAATWSFCW